jgi:hypothetical protein
MTDDGERILIEIGNLKGTMESKFGDVRSDISSVHGEILALAGPKGRVTVLEDQLEKQAMWSKIHTFALLFVPPVVHKGLVVVSKFFI